MELYLSHVMLFLLLAARILSMVVVAPIVGHQAVPVAFKVTVGLFLSLVLVQFVSSTAISPDLQLVEFFVMVLHEVFVGLLLGFSAGIVFAGVRYAGELISFDLGFAFANVVDPETGAHTPVLGEMLYFFAAMIFLLIDGHHALLQALRFSFNVAPIGTWSPMDQYAQSLVQLVGTTFVIAVKIAAPVLVTLFLTNIALAILSRIMPQMNIFAVSFPLKIGVGLIVLVAAAPVFFRLLAGILREFDTSVTELLERM
jgi:flagellar biosynthetic protein FliR